MTQSQFLFRRRHSLCVWLSSGIQPLPPVHPPGFILVLLLTPLKRKICHDSLVFDSRCGLWCLADGMGMGYWYVSGELKFHHYTESPAKFSHRFQLEFIGGFFCPEDTAACGWLDFYCAE